MLIDTLLSLTLSYNLGTICRNYQRNFKFICIDILGHDNNELLCLKPFIILSQDQNRLSYVYNEIIFKMDTMPEFFKPALINLMGFIECAKGNGG